MTSMTHGIIGIIFDWLEWSKFTSVFCQEKLQEECEWIWLDVRESSSFLKLLSWRPSLINRLKNDCSLLLLNGNNNQEDNLITSVPKSSWKSDPKGFEDRKRKEPLYLFPWNLRGSDKTSFEAKEEERRRSCTKRIIVTSMLLMMLLIRCYFNEWMSLSMCFVSICPLFLLIVACEASAGAKVFEWTSSESDSSHSSHWEKNEKEGTRILVFPTRELSSTNSACEGRQWWCPTSFDIHQISVEVIFKNQVGVSFIEGKRRRRIVKPDTSSWQSYSVWQPREKRRKIAKRNLSWMSGYREASWSVKEDSDFNLRKLTWSLKRGSNFVLISIGCKMNVWYFVASNFSAQTLIQRLIKRSFHYTKNVLSSQLF